MKAEAKSPTLLQSDLRSEREGIIGQFGGMDGFRRTRIRRILPEPEPDAADLAHMHEQGFRCFYVRFKDLFACQGYVREETVRGYVRQIRKEGAYSVEPPMVKYVHGKCILVNGHHRTEAFMKLGRKGIVVAYHFMYLEKGDVVDG